MRTNRPPSSSGSPTSSAPSPVIAATASRRLRLNPTESYTVAILRCTEQGNGEAQAAARDLLEDLAPAWILVVGIAGGVPAREFSLGDVVVSTRIVDFSVEAVLKDHSREYALAGGPLLPVAAKLAADIPAMVQDGELDVWNNEATIGMQLPRVEIADDKFYGDDAWKKDVRETIERRFGARSLRRPLVTTGAIGSSDRLIKDAEILQVWRKVTRQVQAVEMESAGISRAAHGRQVPFLAIEGHLSAAITSRGRERQRGRTSRQGGTMVRPRLTIEWARDALPWAPVWSAPTGGGTECNDSGAGAGHRPR